MARALTSGLSAVAILLAGLATPAAAADYPSIGSGIGAPQAYAIGPDDDGPDAYVGEPAYYDPPPATAGEPAYYDPPPATAGEPADYDDRSGPPPEDFAPPAYGSSRYSGRSSGSSYSEESYSRSTRAYDSGWMDRGAGGYGGGHASRSSSGFTTFTSSESYGYGAGWGGRYGVRPGARYAGIRIESFESDSGWRGGHVLGHGPPPCPYAHHQTEPHHGCPGAWRHDEGLHLPGSFFADAGGVGPDWIAGGGGGGGFAIVGGGASASAFASARASAHVSVRARGHGGKRGKGGCGCR